MLRRLAPLVGLDGGSRRERDESFAAWRRFLEASPRSSAARARVRGPALGGRGALEFVEHLVDWSTGVPLLVVCTARPELYERHPGWGGGKRNSTTIGALAADSSRDGAAARGAARAAGAAGRDAGGAARALPAATRCTPRSSCACSRDRGPAASTSSRTCRSPRRCRRSSRRGSTRCRRTGRRCSRTPRCVGKVFWAGAVAAMGGRDDRRGRASGCTSCAGRSSCGPARSSSVRDEAEYAFWHALVRDVAYGQIPRATRAREAPRRGRVDRDDGG